MSGEILTTIITVLSIFGFMYRQTALLSAEIKEVRTEIKEVRAEFKEVRADIAAVDKRQSERLSAEIKEVRADIAAVNERLSAEIAAVNERLSAEIAAVDKRLSHTDGLVEGLSRALLSTQAPAQTQAQALA